MKNLKIGFQKEYFNLTLLALNNEFTPVQGRLWPIFSLAAKPNISTSDEKCKQFHVQCSRVKFS